MEIQQCYYDDVIIQYNYIYLLVNVCVQFYIHNTCTELFHFSQIQIPKPNLKMRKMLSRKSKCNYVLSLFKHCLRGLLFL